MEKDRDISSQHIDFELNPPKISGVIFVPNEEGEYEEVKLPTSEENALEIEVDEDTYVDVYGGGRKFIFRVRYKEDGREKETRWTDSSFSPIKRVNTKDKETPFFWQVHKKHGLRDRYSAGTVWRKKGNLS